MSRLVRNVLIVGGGTAGWMTASHLRTVFRDAVNITVIESSQIGRIGVGEATFNTIKVFFNAIGLTEREWMPKCQGTYKLAIRFVGWSGNEHDFYHPYERFQSVNGFTTPEWWLRLKYDKPLDYSCLSAPHLCDTRRSPLFLDGKPFDANTPFPYAYHFDALCLADFLRDFSIQKGVRRLTEDVVDVTLRPDGCIDHVTTRDGISHSADLFIDCTGFRGLLINDALGTPFIPFAKSLLCDRAVVGNLPREYPSDDDINPYTTATTLSAGWVWDIPLFNRTGKGYVYSSHFLSDGEAEIEFRKHVCRLNPDFQVKHLKMRIGRCQNAWVKNCIAIGLSAGFVEPLESTGIFLIQHGIAELISHFPSLDFNNSLVHNYNRTIKDCIEGVRNFLVLHYVLSGRRDTKFWCAAKDEIEIPEPLDEQLYFWRQRFPSAISVSPAYHGFAPYSYVLMLAGLGHLPEECSPAIRHLDGYQRARELFDALDERTKLLGTELPSHEQYLRTVIFPT